MLRYMDTQTPAPILITYASRHGSTQEIARAMADELHRLGLVVDVCAAERVVNIDGYAAIVLGSAVYVGDWLPVARQFVERFQSQLAHMPVWLFSSGPLGAVDPKPVGDPIGVNEIIKRTHARGHHVFAGRLELDTLGFGERLLARLVSAPEGDFRDWEAIRAWARDVATQVAEMPVLTAA